MNTRRHSLRTLSLAALALASGAPGWASAPAPTSKAAKAAKPAVPEFEFDYDLMPYKVPLAPLAKAKKATLNVFGYASSRTRNTDIVSHKMANFRVSAARAENVANALRRAGMPASKIKVEALSDSNPAYLEVMPEGERLNRRAEIYISY